MDTLGTLLIEKGDTARGLELLRKASGLAPNVPDLRLNLAKGLIKANQKDAAKKELAELAKLGDKFPAQSEVTKLMQGL
jgi:predicted Zn-dependent protease